MINLENYKIILKKDCNELNIIYGIILLNKKHTIKDFQQEIYRAKQKAYEEIQKFGDDWYYIEQHMSKDFDYIELPFDENDYIVF